MVCHYLNLAFVCASAVVSNSDTRCYFHEWNSKIPQLMTVSNT